MTNTHFKYPLKPLKLKNAKITDTTAFGNRI